VPPLLHLERGFSKLAAAGYEKTSDATGPFPKPGSYNCIAWAARDPNKNHWWWPSVNGYWPFWIKRREETVYCFLKTFRRLGYRICASSRHEFGFEKVVLYAINKNHRPAAVPNTMHDLNDDWEPTHMARQLPDGTWTSKCGGNEDITHYTLDALESYGPAYGSGDEYGCPVLYLRRLVPVSWAVRIFQILLWKVELIWERR
jgi:hypothetical protein